MVQAAAATAVVGMVAAAAAICVNERRRPQRQLAAAYRPLKILNFCGEPAVLVQVEIV